MARDKSKNLEEKLIDAAVQIITTKGLDSLSVRSIVANAGCSAGTLYNYFQDMNELVLRINSKTLMQLEQTLSQAIANKKEKQNLGALLAREYLNFAQKNPCFWNLLFHYRIPADKKIPEWYSNIINKNFALLESALKPHIDEKLVYKASRVLWGAFHGIISLSLNGKLSIASKETSESLCESLFENYIRGSK